jgi:hypothetical protein
MKMRGAWGISVKFMGVGTLLFCVLTVLWSWKNHVLASKVGETAGAVKVEDKPAAAKQTPRWTEAYGRLPLSFEENVGQTSREVRYVSRGSGYDLFLTAQEAVLALRPNGRYDLTPLHRAASLRAIREARKAARLTAVHLRLDGANPSPRIAGLERLPTKVNYFIGNDPQNWHTDVRSFARVKYEEVYPGVDLVFYGNRQRLEYDFVVAPGADPNAIQLKIAGASKTRINARGDLELSVPGGEVALQKPRIYQQVNGVQHEIAGNYLVTRSHGVRFSVADYDHSKALILDPVLDYSTYLGGSGTENSIPAAAIAVDSSGDAFITGQTTSIDFPTGTNGGVVAAPNPNSGAVYVAELNPTGSSLLYSTYLAGSTTSGGESGFGIEVDSTGKVYVTGVTFATDYPTTSNALKPGPLGSNVGTAFVTKLDPTASGMSSLLYSTFLGGTGGDAGNAIAVDSVGNAYVAGITLSTDFPTRGAFQSAPAAGNTSGSVFLTRIDTTQSGANSLIYSTYLGGNGVNSAGLLFGDQAFGVAVDSSKIAYVSGTTTSTNFPTTAATAFQTTVPAGNTLGAAFVSKIDTTMTGAASLLYSTYLAGSTEDIGTAIALGPSNVAYVTGTTNSTDYPTTTGAFQTTGATRALVSLVDTTLSHAASLKYSTYLGGTGGDTAFGIKADGSGNAYVAGTTASTDFPLPPGPLQATRLNASGDAFIAKLNPAGGGASDLLYATYYGGSGSGASADQGLGIAIDSASPPNAYITGETFSTNLPVLSALSSGGSLHGTSDGYVAKLTLIPTLTVAPSPFNFGTQPVGVATNPQQFTVTNNTATTATFTSIVTTGVSPAANADFAKSNDACSPAGVGAGLTCKVSVIFTPSVAAAESATLVITATVTNGGQNSTIVLNVNLSGTGMPVAPGVGFNPTSLAFGNQVLNTTSAAKTVTLTNTGNAAVTINSIAASGDFAATSTGASACPIGPATLAAGANCTINVTFTPTVLGARVGTLTVTDNAVGSPHTVGLTGTGIAATPDFGLTGPTAVQNVTDGQTLMFNVTVTGVNGFNSPVALACTGAPTLAVCTVTSPVTPPVAPPSSVQAQVSMTTKAFVVPPLSEPVPPPLSPRQVVPLILAFLLLLSLRWARRPRLRLAMAGALFLLIAFAGCNGFKGPHTPKGPATLTITGTSGALQHTVQVQILVN